MCVISVIIPIYNGESTLSKCLNSILHQAHPSLEILLLDDGSTDHTPSICQEYAAHHPQVHYHLLPHGGVSRARQFGLNHACGEYICFVDCDDLTLPTMFDKLLKLVIENNALLGVCGYYTVKNAQRTAILPPTTTLISADDALRYLFNNDGVGGFLWNKIYHRSLLTDDLFDTSLTHCEDLYLNTQLLSHAHFSVALCSEPLYEYYDTATGATSSMHFFDADKSFCYSSAFEKIFMTLSAFQKTDAISAAHTKYAEILEYSMYTLLITGATATSDFSSLKRTMRHALLHAFRSRKTMRQKFHYLLLTFLPRLYARFRL